MEERNGVSGKNTRVGFHFPGQDGGGGEKNLLEAIKIRFQETLILHVPDLPPGDVEVILLREEGECVPIDEALSHMPRHQVGKILSGLRREDIYNDAR